MLVVTAAAAVLASGVLASASSSPSRNRAAAQSYLLALYEYESAKPSSASVTDARALAQRLGGECPGVLAHTPLLPREATGAPAGVRPGLRVDAQLTRLISELELAIFAAEAPGEQQTRERFASTLLALRWSDGQVTKLVRGAATALRAQALAPQPDVCADMRAWVTSGYTKLPASTGEAVKRFTGPLEALALADTVVARYDRLYAEVTMRRIARLYASSSRSKRLTATFQGLERTLGLPAGFNRPAPEHAAGSKQIGSGRTAVGRRYTVWLEPSQSSGAGGSPCALQLSINGSGGSSGACLSRHPSTPWGNVNCAEGVLTVTAETLPTARRARLELSDGSHLVSPLVIVPARLGGPATYFFQEVRGPSPIPVSLAELGADGRVLGALKLPRVVECTRNPIKYVPGGVKTIVRSRLPGGGTYTIAGERHRFLGKVTFSLKVEVRSSGGGSSSSGGGGQSTGRVFAWSSDSGCDKHFYTILYGTLASPQDTVLARTATGAVKLSKAAIPGSLRQTGVLAYAALTEQPREIVVRAPGGKTVLDEHLPATPEPFCESEGVEGRAEGATAHSFSSGG